ncbi:alpha-hydroxy acid oxidase [Cupriavidus pauculus]|nr:alpha-hydroxy acid oxidase [Cupriavidus pauculus]
MMKQALDAPGQTPPRQAWAGIGGSSLRGALAKVLALDDFEALARKRLPKAIYGYISGAAERNLTRDDNRNAYDGWGFVPRVLRNVAHRSMRTSLFGVDYAAPFGIAPMGIAALSTYQGDIVLAQAAEQANIPFVLSGTSLTRMEDVAKAAPSSWFQAYLPGTPERIDALVSRVAAAGFRTLVVTVDIPVAGNRENIMRAGFSTPLRPGVKLAWDGVSHPRWLLGTFARTLLNGMPHFENSFAERGAPIVSRTVDRDFSQRDHFDWSHIRRIRERWKGDLVIKGIISPEDAVLARSHGADAVVLSNHGGRQLDGAISPLRVLPAVVDAVGNMPVMIDGGVRRGTDVVKALALGAKFVFVGRPFNYAAAVASCPGVAHGISLLKAEIDRDLAMLGVTGLDELSSSHLRRFY